MRNNYKPYSIQQLFNYAFGLVDPIYMVDQGKGSSFNPDYPGVKFKSKEEAKRMSWMGTPIMFPITFPAGQYKMYDVQGYLKPQPVEVAAWDLPGTTLVDFNRPKNIVRTEVLGGNGTVKEIYGFDDWQIRMRGIALNDSEKTAREHIDDLLRFEKIADSIEVDGELFADKDIERIVIQEVDIKQVQAQPGMIPFEIKAISDEPLELIIGL